MPDTIHLHWLYRRGACALEGLSKAASLCGIMNLVIDHVSCEVTACTCGRCLEIAAQHKESSK